MSRNGLYTLILGLSLAGYTWLGLNAFLVTTHDSDSFTVCLIKNTTGVSCPACGTTRSMLSTINGKFSEAIYHNPLGPLMVLLIIAFPTWIILDLIRNKNHFYTFYKKVELAFERKIIAIPSALILIAIWAWNIYKDS